MSTTSSVGEWDERGPSEVESTGGNERRHIEPRGPIEPRRPIEDGFLLIGIAVVLVAVSVVVGKQLAGGNFIDSDVSEWFLARRTSTWNSITEVLGVMASTKPVVGICVTVIIVSLVRRRTIGLVVLVVGMTGEVLMFLAITSLVSRPRPTVAHLDPAPPTSSFPSGHTFGTFVLWSTLFVLAGRQGWPRHLRQLIGAVAILLPLAVALSRLYRGMHHPSDVVASLVLGTLWVTAVVRLFPARRRAGGGELPSAPARRHAPQYSPEAPAIGDRESTRVDGPRETVRDHVVHTQPAQQGRVP